MGEITRKTRQFIVDTMSELRKCTWPTKKELTEQTMLVIVAVIILALFIAVIDRIDLELINWLTLK